ncbi:mannose-6-phosphate isomerase [Candidatus Woesearchaeota archaeon]|jgi:mannose-6-phosphate isomerase|nr:mannose-6-phosphate isomerase [Candidatus Woesearchaeota archaeon]MBT4110966.1 mannose-6-phosphate isomerase [Candidatus Woesearchaeota archaeon]MBT4336522.1 mannose-6-phosphate isomerase [Candidatus Woesearchaeota archaeon]MBT4469729.1 mannose-6-phosphate isomerase [Candidatus Woesearchaeota archaeon]MBT6744091.1 mannose-6-phosphate isomerase [Candidatus Woesearchaeota archaeon]
MKDKDFYSEKRPWGNYTLFADNEQCSVKILEVSGQLSLQSHNYREESWYVISGKIEVLRGPVHEGLDVIKKNLETFNLSAGDNIFIPVKHVHTMKSTGEGSAFVLEVSKGEYKEDDIIRYEDIYGRVK